MIHTPTERLNFTQFYFFSLITIDRHFHQISSPYKYTVYTLSVLGLHVHRSHIDLIWVRFVLAVIFLFLSFHSHIWDDLQRKLGQCDGEEDRGRERQEVGVGRVQMKQSKCLKCKLYPNSIFSGKRFLF